MGALRIELLLIATFLDLTGTKYKKWLHKLGMPQFPQLANNLSGVKSNNNNEISHNGSKSWWQIVSQSVRYNIDCIFLVLSITNKHHKEFTS